MGAESAELELENPNNRTPAAVDLYLGLDEGEGAIMVSTPGMAFESSWDDALRAADGLLSFQPDGSGFSVPISTLRCIGPMMPAKVSVFIRS